MIGEHRFSHSYRKIGKALVGVVCLRMTMPVFHVPFTDKSSQDDFTTAVSNFQHWIGYPAVDGGFE